MRTEKINIYKFDELDENVQEKVIAEWGIDGMDHEWWDFEDSMEIGKIMGINIDKIYFSGFSSQGDGACFEGSYSYRIGSVRAIKEYAPLDKKLHRIALDLSKAQRPCFYGLTANVKQRGHYMHEMCTNFNVYNESELGDYYVSDDTENSIIEPLRDFMRWIYKTLEKEYEYLTSAEAVKETIEANDYEFYADGSLT